MMNGRMFSAMSKVRFSVQGDQCLYDWSLLYILPGSRGHVDAFLILSATRKAHMIEYRSRQTLREKETKEQSFTDNKLLTSGFV